MFVLQDLQKICRDLFARLRRGLGEDRQDRGDGEEAFPVLRRAVRLAAQEEGDG